MADFFSSTNLMMLGARLLAFVVCIPFHEAAHAFVSDKLGDHTARDLGRLTLNPLKHLDPWGLLAMLTIGVGWAKPVPVNPNAYKNKRLGMALTAIAGPLSNLLLAYVSMVLYKVTVWGWITWGSGDFPAAMQVIYNILYYLAIININLAVFNMLPIPPFDGSRVFGLILPERLYFKVMKYERFIMFGVLALLWLGVFSPLLGTLNEWAMKGLDWTTGYIDLLFGALLG